MANGLGLDNRYSLYNKRFEVRKPQLESIGFEWIEVTGVFRIKGVYSVYWERVVQDTDEEWVSNLEFIKKSISKK